MLLRNEYNQRVPLPCGWTETFSLWNRFLFSSSKAFWHVGIVEKAIFWWYLDNLALFFGNLLPNYFWALLRLLKYNVRLTPLQFIWQKLSSTINISAVILEKQKKMLKIADFFNVGLKYFGQQIFPRHAVGGSKLAI